MKPDLKLAFLFPGQGAQTVAMGRDLADISPAARATFAEADDALGFALSDLIFSGPAETLQLTEHAQPAILTVSVAAWRALTEALPEATAIVSAGHSLGEYSAHVAAGTFSFADAVRAVRARGRYMQEAVPPGVGAMAAVLGLPALRVNDLCAQASDELSAPPPTDTTPSESGAPRAAAARAVVAPANLNAPEQTVISGSAAAVERASALCREAGARKVIPLKVSAPFHCALMEPARERLALELEAIAFSDPAWPIVANVDARLVSRAADIRDCLIRQVTGPVRWVECMELLLEQKPTHLIELGPGKVLTGLTRQILGREQAKGIEAPLSLNIEDPESLTKTLAALA